MEDERQPIEWDSASKKVHWFLQLFIKTSAMELVYELSVEANRHPPFLRVVFSGPDARHLLARNAELLHAMESIVAGVLRLSPEQHDLISFDAEGYKAKRAQQMHRAAEVAIASVKATSRPYSFPPMNSRERRMLHLELMDSGLRTALFGRAFQTVRCPLPRAGAFSDVGW